MRLFTSKKSRRSRAKSRRRTSTPQGATRHKSATRRLCWEPLEERELLAVLSGGEPSTDAMLLEAATVGSPTASPDTSVSTLSSDSTALAAATSPQQSGVWISVEEVMRLPTSGKAWDTVVSAAKGSISSPDISNQDDKTDTTTLAKALVGVRTGNQSYINEVRSTIIKAMETENGGRTLALARNLAPYVISADLVGLDSAQDAQFRDWLRGVIHENLSGKTLISTHEDRPNNWGTIAGGSRAAAAVYLGDQAELARTAQVFHGWVGDRSAYAGFSYGDLSWQADPSKPLGINPKGAMKEGHSIDGALPDDMRRGGSFTWPPAQTGYAWEGLQGAMLQAEILGRAGYDTWQWEDQAMLRSVEFLYGIGWDDTGDDQWQPFIIDAHYGTNYADNDAASAGKMMGWTAWTHQFADTGEKNRAPVVSAGTNQTIVLPSSATLDGTVSDDGLLNPPGAVDTTWTAISGPGTVNFANASAVDTTASFSTPGTYVLKLEADDGQLTSSDNLTVVVSGEYSSTTLSFQDGVSDNGTYTGTRDTRLKAAYPDKNYGTNGEMQLDGTPNRGVLLKWDLGAIAQGTHVESASIELYVKDASPDTYEIYEVRQDWAENEATWNEASKGNAWEIAGVQGASDRGSTALGVVTTSSTGLVAFDLNAAGITVVQSWVDNPTSNYGFAIQDYNVRNGLKFYSSDSGRADRHPRLDVTTGDSTPVQNQAPVVAAGTDQTIVLPSSATLDGTVSDDGLPNPPDAVTTTWTAVSGPGTVNFANASAIDTTATFSAAGTYVLRLTADDGQLVTGDELSIVVDSPTQQNQAPVVNAGSDQSIMISAAATLDGTVSDDGLPNPPGAATTTWTAISGPGTVNFANASAIDTTASFSTPGTYVLKLEADDGQLTSSDNLTVVVSGEYSSTTLSFQDGVSDNGTYTGTSDTRVKAAYPDKNYGTNGEMQLDGTPDRGVLLKWDLGAVAPGTHVESASIVLYVKDASPDTYEIYEVRQDWAENEATWNEASKGNAWEIAGVKGASDRGSTALGVLTTSSTGLVAFDLNAAGVAVVQSWVDNPSGNYGFAIQDYEVGNGLKFYSADSGTPANRPRLDVMIGESGPVQNRAPVVSAGTDQTIALPSAATLNGTASDDGLPNPPASLDTTWSKVSGPGTVNFANASAIDTTASFTAAGTYVLQLRANDGELATSDQVTVVVNAQQQQQNQAPQVNAGADQSIVLGGGATLNGTATDDGLPDPPAALDTTWSQVGGPATVNFANPSAIDTTASFSAAGTYTLRLRAGDGELTASDTLTITVSDTPQPQGSGVWISVEEVMRLPTSGKAWDTLVSAAKGSISSPNISNQDSKNDTTTLAKALVGVRTGNQSYINEVRSTIIKAMETENGGRTLALARNLAPYVISADLVGLSSSQDAQFRDWLRGVIHENLSGKTLVSTHEDRPNNWGTIAGGSRAAVAVYLGDQAELARTAQVFHGWLGDRSAYAGFKYGDLSWQADPSNPVGINPVGATKDGHSIDGALPDDMRRGGSFSWPPPKTGYAWEALQGVMVQAEILSRAGYDTWQWEDQAILRAVDFLYDIGWDDTGDDQWQPFLIDAHYGTNYADNDAATAGKIMAWTAWTH